MPNILIGVTGSVAAIKVPELVDKLRSISSVEIQLVATKNSCHFFNPDLLNIKCYKDEDEWTWAAVGDPVLHIELRKWADVLLIAPLDANTLCKMATGICDNLLTCVVRAWDQSRPLIYCPAMNTFMWAHPHTESHTAKLNEFGYIQVPPVSKVLACGDKGIGAMATVDDIVSVVKERLSI